MRNRLSAFCGVIIFAGGLAACSDPTGPTTDPTTGASAVRLSDDVSATRVRLTAILRPPAVHPAFPRASGKAQWTRDGAQRELQIEIEDVRPGVRVNFFVGGVKVGPTRTVSRAGTARIDLSTERGQRVPTSVAGKRVVVRTAAGVVVVQGRF
jgi:hypothetical protein